MSKEKNKSEYVTCGCGCGYFIVEYDPAHWDSYLQCISCGKSFSDEPDSLDIKFDPKRGVFLVNP